MNEQSQSKLAILQKEGFYISTPSGTSMEPMLVGGRDQVQIEPLNQKAKKGDVLLYESAHGEQVLHRVVRVCKDGYLLRGDNRIFTEKVAHDAVIGILTAFWQDGKKVDCRKSLRYRLYTRTRGAAYLLRRVKTKVRKLKKKKEK